MEKLREDWHKGLRYFIVEVPNKTTCPSRYCLRGQNLEDAIEKIESLGRNEDYGKATHINK